MKDRHNNNLSFSIVVFFVFVAVAIIKKDMDAQFIAMISYVVFWLSVFSLVMRVLDKVNAYNQDCNSTFSSNYLNAKFDDQQNPADLVEEIDHKSIPKAFKAAKTIKSENDQLIKDTIEILYDNAFTKILKKIYSVVYCLYFLCIGVIILCFCVPDQATAFFISQNIMRNYTIWSIIIILFDLVVKDPLIDLAYGLYRYIIKLLAKRFINKYIGKYNDDLFYIDKYD